MNNVLTINTASAECSVALQLGAELTQRFSDSQRQSAQRVLPMIAELLSAAGIGLRQLNLIAIVAGPGSFTGVRVAVAVAQGLSMSLDIPVVALSSLALMAMAAMDSNACSHVLVCEEARKGEVYFAAYKQSAALGVELLGKEQVAPPELLDLLAENTAAERWGLTGNGWFKQAEILTRLTCSTYAVVSAPAISNQLISLLANKRFIAGEAVSAEQLRPNYVKEQIDYS